MTGLATTFNTNNGRFSMASGVEKSRDSVNFYCEFDKNRTYLSDYGKNSVSLLHSLLQKPASYVQNNSTMLLGMLQKDLQKYVPNIKVKNIDVGYFAKDRKECFIKVEYTSIQEDKSEINDVIFV